MKVKDYIGYAFSSGCYTGEDYREFEKVAARELKANAAKRGFKLHAFNKGHYEFSAVLERGGKFIYVSISDVRFFQDEFFYNVLVRTMEHDKDWRGGGNNQCRWDEIPELADRLAS